MECVRQDEGDGGKLWDAMRPHKTLGMAALWVEPSWQRDVVSVRKVTRKLRVARMGLRYMDGIGFCCTKI